MARGILLALLDPVDLSDHRIPMATDFASARKILLAVLLANLGVAAAKIFWGGAARSLSMQADGLHSLLDAASSAIGWIGLFLAARPLDDTYPYGRGKYETFASLCISVLLFFTGFEIVQHAVARLQSGVTPEITSASFIVMLVTMAVNGVISRWEKVQGQRYKSEVLVNDGRHTESDLLASFSVMVSLVASFAGYPAVDLIVGLVIAGIIGKVGWQVLIESFRVLVDASRIDPDQISPVVMQIDGVLACHKVRTRGNMGQVYVDLHIHVAPEMSIAVAHILAHRAEAAVMQSFSDVAEVAVHLEPHLPHLEND